MKLRNMLDKYICAIDIGSSKISGVLAKIRKDKICDIFFDTVAARGVRRGAIVDSVDLVGYISRILKSLKEKSDINIKVVYGNISGEDIVARHSRAVIPLAERGNKVITFSDIQRVNDQARILGSSLEEDIIHAMPYKYGIDSNGNILNPLGLYSHRLETDLYLICGKASSIQSLIRAVNQSGYEIKDLFFSGLATSKAVFDREFKEGTHVLCDMGSDITELLLFDEGTLKDVKILFMGGDDLTLQLCETLKIPFDLSEDIKRSYSSVGDGEQIKEDKEILVKKSNIYKPIKQRLVSELVTQKTKAMCEKIREATYGAWPLSKIDNFTVSGRAVLLEGFLETLENTLGKSVKIGRIVNPAISGAVNSKSELSGQKYLSYLTALGIISQAMTAEPVAFAPEMPQTRNPFLKLAYKVNGVYQEYF